MKKILAALALTAAILPLTHAGLYDQSTPSQPLTTLAATSAPPSRIVPAGCAPDQPIDSCAPSVKPFDCSPGRHWTNEGGNGLAHCVDNDPVCSSNYSLTHDALGNPSCVYTPATQTQTDPSAGAYKAPPVCNEYQVLEGNECLWMYARCVNLSPLPHWQQPTQVASLGITFVYPDQVSTFRYGAWNMLWFDGSTVRPGNNVPLCYVLQFGA